MPITTRTVLRLIGCVPFATSDRTQVREQVDGERLVCRLVYSPVKLFVPPSGK